MLIKPINHFGPTGSAEPYFYAPFSSSGISELPLNLIVNGQEQAPFLRYEAKDISGSTWTSVVGDDLTLVGTGNDPTPGLSTPFFDDSESVRFNGGKSFQGSSSFSEVDTEDVVYELIIDAHISRGCYIANYHSSPDYGFSLNQDGTQINLAVRSAAGGTVPKVSNALHDGLNHLLMFWDRDVGVIAYLNGDDASALGTSLNIHDGYGLTGSANFTIGARPNLTTNRANQQILYAAAWKRNNWLDNNTSSLQSSVAKHRFGLLCGLNSSSANYYNFVKGSGASTILEKNGIKSVYLFSDNWIRNGTTNGHNGYLCEKQATNNLVKSGFLASTSWNANNGTSSADQITSSVFIYSGAYGDSYVADTLSSDDHGISQDNISVTSASLYISSCFVKAGDNSAIAMYVSGNAAAMFDISGGSVYEIYSSSFPDVNTASIESMGDDWYRIWVNYYAPASTIDFDVRTFNAFSTASWAGDGATVNYYINAAQLEEADTTSSGPTTWIYTDTSTATRVEDNLYFTGSNIIPTSSVGTIQARFAMRDVGNIDGRQIINTTDSTALDYVSVYATTSSNSLLITGSDGLYIDPAGPNVYDGGIYTASLMFRKDMNRIYVNGEPASGTYEDNNYDHASASGQYVYVGYGNFLNGGYTFPFSGGINNATFSHIAFYDIIKRN